MTTIKTYRGRFVHYDLGQFTYRDPGHTSDWGQHPLVFDGVGPVQVRTSDGPSGPLFEGVYTYIDGCAWTFWEYLGAEQVLLLGDFIFIGRSNGPYSIFNPFTLLVVESNEILRVQRDYSGKSGSCVVGLPCGVTPPVDTDTPINKSDKHLSPCWNGPVPEDAEYVEWTEDEHSAFLEQFPKLSTCNGAVQVYLFNTETKEKVKRWLFPHPEGARAAWEHLQNTTREDDWTRLQTMLDDAHPIERERVLASFTGE